MKDFDQFLGKCILLAEDENCCSKLIDRYLTVLGFSDVLVATNLIDAEKIAQSKIPDIALVNVNLNEGFGFVELGRTVATRGIPVLFMSALNLKETAMATRGFELVEKPLSLPRLKAALHRTMLRANSGKQPPLT